MINDDGGSTRMPRLRGAYLTRRSFQMLRQAVERGTVGIAEPHRDCFRCISKEPKQGDGIRYKSRRRGERGLAADLVLFR